MTDDRLPKEYSVGAFGKILKDKLGIETGAVTIIKRKDSWAAVEEKRKIVRSVPYLSIKARVPDFEKIICDYRPQGLVNKEYHEKILALWLKYVSGKYGDYSEYYDPEMFIGAECFDDECYERFAREEKQLVLRYLISTLGKAPDKIYASSEPGISIVYSTFDYLSLKLNIASVKDGVRNGVTDLAKDYVEKKYGKLECRLNVRIFHTRSKEYDYFLTRED